MVGHLDVLAVIAHDHLLASERVRYVTQRIDHFFHVVRDEAGEALWQFPYQDHVPGLAHLLRIVGEVELVLLKVLRAEGKLCEIS